MNHRRTGHAAKSRDLTIDGVKMMNPDRHDNAVSEVIGTILLISLVVIGIGIVAALALTRLLSNLLFGVTPTDPLTFGIMIPAP